MLSHVQGLPPELILRKRGVRAVIHYMDDFLLMGAPGTAECSQALATTIATCEELGVPLAVDKIEGPATKLSFLGIQLNSREMRTSLPPDKLAELRTMVMELVGARVVRDRQQLESLVGHFMHAAIVFPLGIAFLNALFATKAAIKPGQIGRLNLAAVVSQVIRLHARDPQASHMLRCLAYLQALYDCRLRAVHAAGSKNKEADHLSRNRVTSFRRRHPQASPAPSQVPPALVRQITQQASEWTSFR